jgi:hypothetical protein
LTARASCSKPIAAEEAETPRSCWTAIQSERTRRRALLRFNMRNWMPARSIARHDAVERVDLANEMTLAEPADRRVARHLADRRPLVCEKQRARTEPGSRSSRLAAGVPTPDHCDVVLSQALHQGRGM